MKEFLRRSRSTLPLIPATWLFLYCAAIELPGILKAQSSTGPGEVAVESLHLPRDFLPWIPYGFHQIAFAVAPGDFPHPALKFFQIASYNYSRDEYVQMKAAGADSVRIEVAQNGMDPQRRILHI